ncbi:hypothetical protein R5R35_012742 [Gryllus longicercus]|uniref:Uncharacterized protein n=1 Tax=Gryllus longicercus TaxID=2509291 RepID=A0AAN9VWS6_9ORTH
MLAVATFWPHFMIHKSYKHNLVENAANPAVSRLFWGTAIAWIIFACHTGYGGLLNRFLNCYAFRVLSRISYSTNMAHFILLLHNSGRRRVPVWFDIFAWIQVFFADYGIGTTLGLLVFLIFESPICLVSQLYLLKGFSKKTMPPSVHIINKSK